MVKPTLSVISLISALALAACGDDPQIAPKPEETAIPERFQGGSDAAPTVTDTNELSGTPMAERIATIGVLNKRNNVSQDLEMKPGEARRLGDVIIRLSACERTPQWEMPKQTGAFVQVLVENKEEEDSWNRIFSGWLIKESPSVNVVEHPIYDVWVKDCAMTFPGDTTVAPDSAPTEEPEAPVAPAPATNDT